jgi:hypothetical protein
MRINNAHLLRDIEAILLQAEVDKLQRKLDNDLNYRMIDIELYQFSFEYTQCHRQRSRNQTASWKNFLSRHIKLLHIRHAIGEVLSYMSGVESDENSSAIFALRRSSVNIELYLRTRSLISHLKD